MQSDSATRALLALILLCLVILVVQGLAADDPFDAGWGRYQVTGMRAGAPVLIRTDTVTGQVWKLELRGGGNRWVAFAEPEESGGEGEPAQAARESRDDSVEAARAERDVVEPPGAPPLPSEPPRASPEVLEALPPAGSASEASSASGAASELETLERFASAVGNAQLPTDMRVWVAEQLANRPEGPATRALLAATDDENTAVVAASLRALAGRDDPRVHAAAEKARASDVPEVRSAAEELLASLE